MAIVSWIHLSDLHLNQKKHGWRSRPLLKKLLGDAKNLKEKEQLHPQFLLVTGDLAYGEGVAGVKIKDQFHEALSFLTQLMAEMHISEDNLFIVPGNHDVNRKKVLSMHDTFLDSLNKRPSYEHSRHTINEMFKNMDRQLKSFMNRLSNYKAALKKSHGYLVEDKHFVYGKVREIEGVSIGIAGLNGVWSCGGDNEKGKLWMGSEWQLAYCQEALEEADLKIGLIHHPTDWYVPAEAAILKDKLEFSFDFLLHGHEHQSWVQHINNRHTRIAAGAVFGGSPDEMGYNIVRFDTETRNGEVWLRCFNSRGEGGWQAEHIPSLNNEKGVFFIGAEQRFGTKPKAGRPEPQDLTSHDPAFLFVGRNEELRVLEDAMNRKRSVTIIGDRHIGKTWLLKTWYLKLPKLGRITRFIDGKGNDAKNAQTFVGTITGSRPEGSPDTVANCLENWAKQLRSNEPPIILVDEFENILHSFPARFLERIRGMVGRVLFVFATAREIDLIYEDLGRTSPFFNILEPMWLGLLHEEHVKTFVDRAQPWLTHDERKLMLEEAGGHPFYLNLLAKYLVEARYSGRPIKDALSQFQTAAKPHLGCLIESLSTKDKNRLMKLARGGSCSKVHFHLRGITNEHGLAFGNILTWFLQEET